MAKTLRLDAEDLKYLADDLGALDELPSAEVESLEFRPIYLDHDFKVKRVERDQENVRQGRLVIELRLA